MTRSVLLALASMSVLGAGCLDGDPNPTTQGQGSSGASGTSGTSGTPAPAQTVQPSNRCSTNSTQAVNLPFRNAFTDRAVRLWWVDQACNPVAYDVLMAGQSHVQQTYVGHVWQVRDTVTNALYKEYVPMTTAPPEVVVP